YFFYLTISILIGGFIFKKNLSIPKIILLAIGSYFVFSIFSLINMISAGFLPGIITSIIFLIIFALSIIKIKKLGKQNL
ncbi:hypothetical protein KY317_01105, partial [Candidatus Woesearchaeota archaeon]|nr:hypothetical protein [Candidatus Woesearchaeota archaeon]